MTKYHKIQTVYKRDLKTKHKTLLEGQFSLPEFEYLANNRWRFFEKVNGVNMRVLPGTGWNPFNFMGKTDDAQMIPALNDALQNLFYPKIEQFMNLFDGNFNVCLYGEGYGACVRKGSGLYRPTPGFVLFDVKVDEWWLSRENVVDVAQKLEIDVVPEFGSGTLFDMVEHARQGITSAWGDFQAEGLVGIPETALCTRGGERIITKIKCSDFRRP